MILAALAATSATIWVDPLVIIGIVFTILGGLYAVWRKALRPFVHGIKNFLKDFNGEPERPGVAKRLGVMERLSLQDVKLEAIASEVNYNHGSSIKDAVHRIDSTVSGISAQLEGLSSAQGKNEIRQEAYRVRQEVPDAPEPV